MAATNKDVDEPSEWRIDDEPLQLREWGSGTLYRLPLTHDEVTIGAAAGCEIQLADQTARVSQRHAKLTHKEGRWIIKDLHSTNGIKLDGARRRAFALAPGIEIGIGGVTLIVESARLCALREIVARLLGWAPGRRAAVDLALRAIRTAATRRGILLLCGEGDLEPVARLLHRHALGDERPFVVCDPGRRRSDSTGRRAANFDDGLLALAAAAGGTLCISSARPPARFAKLLEAQRAPDSRVQLVACARTLDHGELVAAPIVLPPLKQRKAELNRIIDAYADEAVATLGGRFLAIDRDWVRTHEAETLPQIEIATWRLLAIRNARGKLTPAAAQLGMSHSALSEWVAYRHALPEVEP